MVAGPFSGVDFSLPLGQVWPPSPSQRMVCRSLRSAALGPSKLGNCCSKLGAGLREQYPILWPPGSRHAGLDRRKIELGGLRVFRLRRIRGVEPSLFFGIRLHQLDLLRAAPRQSQIAQGLRVDGENAAGCAILRRHVADRGPVREAQFAHAGAVKLNKLAHHAQLAQHLGHGQHQVGGRRALAQLARQLEPDHLRHQHRNRLAQHGGLGFDPADAPAQHPQPVDHGGMRVGAHQRVRIRPDHSVLAARGKDHARQVFQVDLVADAHARRHGGEVAERGLAPFQKGVAFPVALKLKRGVDGIGIRSTEFVHLHRVVDHQLRRLQGIDLLRIAAQLLHGVAHGGQIDDGGYSGKVLHQHPRRHKRDLPRRLGVGLPLGQKFDVVRGHALAVFLPQQVFQQHAQAVRKTMEGEAFGLQRLRRKIS